MLDRSKQPRTKITTTLNIPNVEKTKFENGIECHIINTTDQEIIRIDWVFKTNKTSNSSNFILPVYAANLLKEGCTNYNAQQISEQFDFCGAICTVTCGQTSTSITLLCLKKHSSLLIDLVYKIITEPTYNEKQLSTHIAQHIAQYKLNIEKIGFISLQAFHKALYGTHHPACINSDINNYQISREQLIDFHKNHYNYKECNIVVSGNTDSNIIELINNSFGKKTWGGENDIINQKYAINSSDNFKQTIIKEQSIQTAITLGFESVTNSHHDYIGLKFLNCALGGYFGSRLNKSIREKKGYTYGIYSSILSTKDYSQFIIRTKTANQVASKTIKAIHAEFDKLRQKPISNTEFKTVRNIIINEINTKLEEPLGAAEFYCALMANNYDFNYYKKFQEFFESTTPLEIQSIAQRQLPEQCYEIMVGKPD